MGIDKFLLLRYNQDALNDKVITTWKEEYLWVKKGTSNVSYVDQYIKKKLDLIKSKHILNCHAPVAGVRRSIYGLEKTKLTYTCTTMQI
jgi:hypothetical protein